MDYETIEGQCCAENIIKKSRFIVNCYHVEDELEIDVLLKAIQKQHYKATHNTFAYTLGEGKGIQKCSDDGEPSGTAGKPILEVIMQHNLTNILIVITRYFGGIKLGGGGLIRAYSGAATLGISTAKHIKMQYSYLMEISCEYTNLGKIKAYIDKKSLKEEDTIYDDKVRIRVYIPTEETQNFISDLVELTNDQVFIETIKEDYIKIYSN